MKNLDLSQLQDYTKVITMINPKKELSEDSNDRSSIVFDIPQPDTKKKLADPSLTLKWGVTLKDEVGDKVDGFETSDPPLTSRMSKTQYATVAAQFEPRELKQEKKPRPNSKRAGFGIEMELSSIKRPSDTDYRDDLSIQKPLTARNPFRKANDFIIKSSSQGVHDVVEPGDAYSPALTSRSQVKFDIPQTGPMGVVANQTNLETIKERFKPASQQQTRVRVLNYDKGNRDLRDIARQSGSFGSA